MDKKLQSIADLTSDPRNPRSISQKAISGLGYSMAEFGDLSGITFNSRTGELVCGHQRVKTLREKYGNLEITGDKIHTPEGYEFSVRVVDWPRSKQSAANVAANASTIQGEFTEELGDLLKEIEEETPDAFDAMSFDELLGEVEPERAEGLTDPDDVPEINEKAEPICKLGDIWQLGRHRVMCGDSADIGNLHKLFSENEPDTIITDPPYCSGGFQESGKRAGSIGTINPEKIANDMLSTRGYQALIRSALFGCRSAEVVYVFTDWRMWVNLFDIVESSGFSIRNMVVWDKETAGMGLGWRAQHELIMVGVKSKSPFSLDNSQGNVVKQKRTGNQNHPTEKPVSLIQTIIEVSNIVKNIYDPFSGSGTTLIAAEQTGRTCYGMELSPKYCDVIIKRWEDFTGQKAVRVE